MDSKEFYPQIGGGDQSEDGEKPPKLNCQNEDSASPSQQTSTQMEIETPPEAGEKGNDAGHGNRFQSKLLMLYAVRAINLGYLFYLGTELSVGEKFDDLIFHYKEENDVTFRQQYLQAKHRLNENDHSKQITANHLLDVKKGDFSLLKYFQSYIKIRSQGNDIEHCIICTNVDFNHQDLFKELEKYGMIVLGIRKSHWPKLLNCKDIKNDQASYKLKNLDNFKNTVLLGNVLNSVTNCTGEEMKSLFQNCTEVVNGKQFNDHTADEMNNFFIHPAQNQNQLVQKLVEFLFDNFLDKLILVVKTPNEDELDFILTNEVGKYFKLSNSALQSAHFMNEMVNWFKLPDEKHHWLKAKEAEDILKAKTKKYIKMIELTSFSFDYQKQLKQIKTSENSELKFEDTVINKLTSMLQSFWDSQEKIKHVSSKTPKLTAVKVFSAIKKLPEFPNKDDYLVISSKRLKEKKKKVKKSMKGIGHNLLVVVNEDAKNPVEDDSFYEKFIPENLKKKVIVISSQNFTKESYDEDTITYGQLNENTKKVLRERQVSFQGNELTVNDLIDMKQVDKVLDSQLIGNLLQMAGDDQIVISSFNTSNFEKSFYIERKLTFQSKDHLLNKLADIEEKPDKKVDDQTKVKKNKMNEEIEIDRNGKIKWKTEDDKRKQEIWKELKILLEQNNSDLQLFSIVSERGLIDTTNKRIIITGVAGTGKSTILSHYYDEIKKNKSNYLVIKISLNRYSKILKETNNFNDFLIDKVVDQNSFARSLLKHRLASGDRIILMLDGFDEIDTECQDKVVQLVKNLNESIPLYITTRPHLAEKLQFELSQLAYSLDKFTEDDQINYLTSIWIDSMTKERITHGKEAIKTLAKQLIDRVNKTLKDKEKEFIGIPLQCRILAECFQSKIKDKLINQNTDSDHDLSHLILDGGQQFDLANLYKLMIEEKRRVFREEKIQVNFGQSHIVDNSIENNIKITENHLRKLAFQTIIYDQEDVAFLIPFGGLQSESERKKEEKQSNENGIRFGLLIECGENEIEFLHRTYAEYLVADHIFNGLLLDDEKHNKLLENESARRWIIEDFLLGSIYKGVRVFFDSMLKEIINEDCWRKSIIVTRNLSNRLQQLAFALCGYEEGIDDDESDDYYNEIISLTIAFMEMNANIILFILDCLDVTFYQTPSKIPTLILKSVSFDDYYFYRSADVFTRVLLCFQKDNESKKKIIKLLCECLRVEDNKFEELLKSENVKRFFNFMYDNLEQTETIKNDDEFKSIAIKLTYNKCEEISQQILKIVMSIYSDKFVINLMKEATEKYLGDKNWEFSRIEKTINILKDNGREQVAAELSRSVLFRKFEELKKEENANIRSSLEETGMTGLHGAASRGDLKFIENEIGCSLENPEKCSKEERNSVLQLLAMKDIVLEKLDENFLFDLCDGEWNEYDVCTPFYVSAVYGHEEIFRKIWNFVVVDAVEIDDQKGFLHVVLNNTITKLKNVLMFATIFKSVKEIRGRKALVKVLQSTRCLYLSRNEIKTIVNIFVQEDNGYQDLNDVLFHNCRTLKILHHVEFDVLQKVIAAEGGFDKWIKRLMDTDAYGSVMVLSSDGFLAKFNHEDQIPKLIDILITIRTTEGDATSCYWSDFLKLKYEWTIKKFLAALSKVAGEDDLKRFLFSRDDNNVVILFHYLIRRDKSDFNYILTDLPENLKQKIEDLLKQETPQVIDHLFSSPEFLESLKFKQQWNAIQFYLENGNQEQLSKFSQVVKVDQLKKVLQNTDYDICKTLAKLLRGKLDSQTIVDYNHLIEKYNQ